jgi:hypothetical protein
LAAAGKKQKQTEKDGPQQELQHRKLLLATIIGI